MSSERALLSLIAKIYQAASDSTEWPRTLASLIEIVPAHAASLEVRNFNNADSRIAVSVNWQTPSQEYEQYYAAKNILLIRGADIMTEGSVLCDVEGCPEKEYVRSEYYNDLLLPNGVGHMLGSTVLRRASIGALLVLGRSHNHSPFGEEEKAVMRTLMPHLQSALQLHEKLAQLEDQRRELITALDILQFGVILVDQVGRILVVNRGAERILRDNDGLSAGPERLHVASQRQDVALRALIMQAAAGMNKLGIPPGGVLSVTRRSLRRDYALFVCPFPAQTTGPSLHERVAAAIFITDPEAHCEAPPESLTRLFGLTPAEARLAILLMEGDTLAGASEKIGITRNTAHSQLNAVFAKTGVRRQSELVKLLLSGPAQLRLRAA